MLRVMGYILWTPAGLMWVLLTAFQFQVRPFGLTSAPLVFTQLLWPVMAFLLSQGVCLLFFLDDILVLAHSQQLLIQHVQLVTSTLHTPAFSLSV